jgi:hypothetical protein
MDLEALDEKEEGGDIQLNVQLLPPSDDLEYPGTPTIKIEGDAASLRFLADMIIHLLKGEDCGYHIMAAQELFTPDSQYDLYLHRLPCVNDLLKEQSLGGDIGGDEGTDPQQ